MLAKCDPENKKKQTPQCFYCFFFFFYLLTLFVEIFFRMRRCVQNLKGLVEISEKKQVFSRNFLHKNYNFIFYE